MGRGLRNRPSGSGSGKKSKRKIESESDDDAEDGGEQEVFQLEAEEDDDDDDDDDAEHDDDENEEEEEDDEIDSDDEDDEEDNELRNLVNALPSKMRQKVLQKGKRGDDDSDDGAIQDDEYEEEDEGWGKKKKSYYSGDTADLEIGQDVEDAKDEEEAAQELRAKTLSRMKETDFFEDINDESKPTLKKKEKKMKSDPLTSDLEELALAPSSARVAADAPEFLPLVSELRERVAELQQRVLPITALIKEEKESLESTDEVAQYLQVKQQLLLSYCTNVVFYLLLKSEGQSVKAHPVMKQLLELRYAIEKLRPIDGKLKYQIDRLLKQATGDVSTDALSSSSRPNPQALMNDDDEDENNMVDGGNGEGKKSRGDGVYRAPRIAAVPYKNEESELEKRQEKIDRKRKKIRNSEMFDALRDEFGSAPELTSSTGVELDTVEEKRLEEEAEERRAFEEDRFVRLSLSRKEKKAMKKRGREAGRFDTLDNLGDIGDFEELNDIVGASLVESNRADYSKLTQTSNAAVEKAMRSLQEPSGDADYASFAQMLEAAGPNKKSRRPAPESSIDYDAIEKNAEEEGMLEAFSKRKKEYLDRKKEHYSAEPKYGGVEEAVDPGAKRAASYEIMKNKGLTPHRKKANRNPRVKKREAYDKAVIRRKGQVREAVAGVGASYGGELTGIKANISRSRKIGN